MGEIKIGAGTNHGTGGSIGAITLYWLLAAACSVYYRRDNRTFFPVTTYTDSMQ
jgi:hypothetical protein